MLESCTFHDLDDLMEMAPAMHRESRYSNYPLNLEKWKQTFYLCIADKDAFCVKYSVCGKIVGFFTAYANSMEFTSKKMGIEVSWWVLPEYRHSKAALSLVNSYLGWCKNYELPSYASAHYSKDNQSTYRLYRHCGMKEIGRIFIKED